MSAGGLLITAGAVARCVAVVLVVLLAVPGSVNCSFATVRLVLIHFYVLFVINVLLCDNVQRK